MPTYDYQCDACGHKFEEFQSITAEMLTKCPECKKKKLRRLFGTGAAVMFKGSGFYQTDYRSESYKKGAANDSSGGEGKSQASESGQSQSKSGKSESGKSASKKSGGRESAGGESKASPKSDSSGGKNASSGSKD